MNKELIQKVQQGTQLPLFAQFLIEQILSYTNKRDGWKEGTDQYQSYDLVIREYRKIQDKYIECEYKDTLPATEEAPLQEDFDILEWLKSIGRDPLFVSIEALSLLGKLANHLSTPQPASNETPVKEEGKEE